MSLRYQQNCRNYSSTVALVNQTALRALCFFLTNWHITCRHSRGLVIQFLLFSMMYNKLVLGGTPLSDLRGGSSQDKINPFSSQWQIPQMVAKYTLKPLMVANEKTWWLCLSECLFSCLSPENESNTLISDFFSKK